MKKINWKKLVELAVAVLTVIGSFIGGQVMARTGCVNMFGKEVRV